jgi:hypothetical protein
VGSTVQERLQHGAFAEISLRRKNVKQHAYNSCLIPQGLSKDDEILIPLKPPSQHQAL